MGVTVQQVRAMKPAIRQTPYGWLAMSEKEAPIPVATLGATEDEARARFRESVNGWTRLRAMPDPDWARSDSASG